MDSDKLRNIKIEPEIINQTKTDQRVVINFNVPADLLYFEGHFEKHPVLPGVVLIDWAVKIGHKFFDIKQTFHSMKKIKFHEVITPNTKVVLQLDFDPERNQLIFAYHAGDICHSTGIIVFK